IPVRRKNIGKILLAAAAAVVLLFVIRTALTKSNTTYDFTRVEQAFNSLSADDQNYLLAIYEEDLFINEIQNQEEL
ncbi:MAG: hypothetical protein IJM81_03900, partial [Prevotella sp.]|nr:hypothetical protein [Prevotella sp.]